MAKKHAPLSHITLSGSVPCHSPAGWAPIAQEEDPATTVMTDFRQVVPITIEPHHRIDPALRKMKVAGVRLLLVPDEYDKIIGVITSADILGERPIKLIEETRISRENIRVDMIMTPVEEIEALRMMSVRNATVGQIVDTMQVLRRKHILVVESQDEEEDDDGDQYKIRGLFSASQISRLLGRDITDPEYAAESLAEISRGAHESSP